MPFSLLDPGRRLPLQQCVCLLSVSDFVSVLSELFSCALSSAVCVWAARVVAVVKHGGLHKPFACSASGNDVGMRPIFTSKETSKKLCT